MSEELKQHGFVGVLVEQHQGDCIRRINIPNARLVGTPDTSAAKKDGRCKCSFAISMVGDGCRYCQPQEYIDRMREQIEDSNAETVELVKKLVESHWLMMDCTKKTHPNLDLGLHEALNTKATEWLKANNEGVE